MNKTEMRRFRQLGSALLFGGVFATGAALGTFSLVSPPVELEAGEANFVRSISHDAVSGVRLDEEVVINFKSQLFKPSVGPDTILIRTGTNNGQQAVGRYVLGRFLFDRSAQRRVVIRPEAIREHLQLVRGLSRTDSQRLTNRVIKRIEKTGRFRRLAKIDRDLALFFGPSFGAGTRLDSDTTTGVYPPQLIAGDPLEPYRRIVAGDDALYQAYLVNGDLTAFPQLEQDTEAERFFHPVDPATGVPSADSVLRTREHRRVLIDRRNLKRVMFVPNTPIMADLSDAGLAPASAYAAIIPAAQPGVFNTVLTKRGRRPLLQRAGRDFSTLFTTVAQGITGANLFLGGEARSGVATLQQPRVVNVTPPNGESFVDSTTDWEDPDNQFEVPLPARRTFSVRLRFAQNIDPRTVSPTNFLISKTKVQPGTPNERPVSVPVPVGTFLNQSRLGKVEIEVTPAQNLDPEAEYEVVIRGAVRTLGSLADGTQAQLGTDVRFTFIVGPGPIPLDEIKENFDGIGGRADPGNPLTLGQITTALWFAPPLFDADATGKLVGSFMPFLGFGEGAPADPENPVPFNPNDPDTFPVTDLVVDALNPLTFVTEGLDPGVPGTFGRQIEYEYASVTFQNGGAASVVGRFPLVIRSQTFITMATSNIFANGEDGASGVTNSDILNGGPPGGLGGAGGPGGFRGGDGGDADLTDANGAVILNNGFPQFDPNKFNGQDGFPGHLSTGPGTGGGGRGGFSGDHEGATITDPNTGQPVPEASPERIREAGGGGAHATAGGNGAGIGGTGQTDGDGVVGGSGGPAYGALDMSDQPVNDKGVPTLASAKAGGAGGGGGGMEDDPNAVTGVEDTVGPEDVGGGGGAGGGGGVHLVARTLIELNGSVINCAGGIGGRTFGAGGSGVGEGAPGGCGGGGTIWVQCFGEIIVGSGSTLDAGGGVGSVSNNIGTISPDQQDFPPGAGGVVTGLGGVGGDGYVRLEDADGQIVNFGTIKGVPSTAVFAPVNFKVFPNREPGPDLVIGEYIAHLGVPMVTNQSVAFSRWFNSQLDTPTYVPIFDDPLTPATEGTLISAPAGHRVDILVRTAPGDLNAPGSPALLTATAWTPLSRVGDISDRRFLQFRVDFEMPLSYTFDQARPFVDCVSIAVELN